MLRIAKAVLDDPEGRKQIGEKGLLQFLPSRYAPVVDGDRDTVH